MTNPIDIFADGEECLVRLGRAGAEDVDWHDWRRVKCRP